MSSLMMRFSSEISGRANPVRSSSAFDTSARRCAHAPKSAAVLQSLAEHVLQLLHGGASTRGGHGARRGDASTMVKARERSRRARVVERTRRRARVDDPRGARNGRSRGVRRGRATPARACVRAWSRAASLVARASAPFQTAQEKKYMAHSARQDFSHHPRKTLPKKTSRETRGTTRADVPCTERTTYARAVRERDLRVGLTISHAARSFVARGHLARAVAARAPLPPGDTS